MITGIEMVVVVILISSCLSLWFRASDLENYLIARNIEIYHLKEEIEKLKKEAKNENR
jgi:hypothetical protein